MNDNIKSFIFSALLLFALLALVFTTVTIIKNKNIITQDTLSYGMKQHNFTDCSCLDNLGRTWYSYEGGFINKEANPNANKTNWNKINWSGMNLTG